jgi:hypothetical protein
MVIVIASVIVHDFHVCGPRIGPNKTHAESIVDADAVLASTIPLESFKSVSRRDPKELKSRRRSQLREFARRDLGDAGESGAPASREQRLRIGAFERLNQS